MRRNGISSIFVLGPKGRLAGLVTVDDAVKAIESDVDFESLIRNDFPQVEPDTPLEALIPIAAEARYPIAVVDNDETLLGIIVRVTVLASLARTGGADVADEEASKVVGATPESE